MTISLVEKSAQQLGGGGGGGEEYHLPIDKKRKMILDSRSVHNATDSLLFGYPSVKE